MKRDYNFDAEENGFDDYRLISSAETEEDSDFAGGENSLRPETPPSPPTSPANSWTG